MEDGKYNVDKMDEKLFNLLSPEEKNEYERRKEKLEWQAKHHKPRAGRGTICGPDQRNRFLASHHSRTGPYLVT